MKKRQMFTKDELKILPVGFQFFDHVPKAIRKVEIDTSIKGLVKPLVRMNFYSSDKCTVFKFHKPISKIVKPNNDEKN